MFLLLSLSESLEGLQGCRVAGTHSNIYSYVNIEKILVVWLKKYIPYSIFYSDFFGMYPHRKKKVREFPVPSRDVATKLFLGGNNDVITELFLPRGSLVSDIPAGDGNLVNLFLRCTLGLHVLFGGSRNKETPRLLAEIRALPCGRQARCQWATPHPLKEYIMADF
jgi:hypothetical protein